MENVKKGIQLIDHMVQDYEMHLNNKIQENLNIELNCTITFKLVKIEEKEKEKIGQISLDYTVDLAENKNNLGKIHLIMQALFTTSLDISNEEFENMLKYDGTATAMPIIKACVASNTALSGMPTIKLPAIDPAVFFQNENK